MTEQTPMAPTDQNHQADPAQRRRLRWRARRGLLENDLILTRYLDQHERNLSDDDVEGLSRLLDLTDNQLMALLLDREQPSEELRDPRVLAVLEMLRAA